ncbi:hypothetical protein [Embleya sp. NBC_00896]|uniref:hypothetical protein n=1 Tax=Embleya sp. NBC_00896 TaxID=2975961 RepID=UPI002F9102F7|nr:hypothetical protein OG928_46505 [Embleya sp. NBC_00896]
MAEGGHEESSPECEPVARLLGMTDLFVSNDEVLPQVAVSAELRKDGGAAESGYQLALEQYRGVDAEQLLSAARAALSTCTRTSEGNPLKEGAKLGFGDGSLVLDIEADDKSIVTVTFVRSGTVLFQAVPLGANLSASGSQAKAPDKAVPSELVRAQFDKLVKAQTR